MDRITPTYLNLDGSTRTLPQNAAITQGSRARTIISIKANSPLQEARQRAELAYQKANSYTQADQQEQAIASLLTAAGLGHTKAQCQLGFYYFEIKVYKDSFYWFMQAALQNHAQACFNLAVLYAKGLGTNKNGTTSLKFLKKAAALGSAEANYHLGVYCHAQEAYWDAFEYFATAAKQHFIGAYAALQYMCSQGQPADPRLETTMQAA